MSANTARTIRMAAAVALLGGLPVAPASVADDAGPRPVVALLPIKLLDTSAEPTDQRANHARRLIAMDGMIGDALATEKAFVIARVPGKRVKARCPDETPQCLLDLAREEGADLVFIGVVHKSSTLIMQMWARLVDARTGRDVLARDLNFRGDNDEAWQRAATFLVMQLKAEGPLR